MKTTAGIALSLVATLAASAEEATTAPARAGLPNPFFAYKNSMEQEGPASIDEQVQILKDLGFDGFDNRDLDDIEEAVRALEKRGLKLFTSYFTVNIDPGEEPYNPRLPEVLPLLKNHGTILWCNTHSKKFAPSDEAGDEYAVPLFQKLADLAAPYGVKVAPYPHITFWVETAEDTVRLHKKVGRENFGTSFNLFHWRAMKDKARPLEEVARAVTPHMFVMSINGSHGPADIGPLEMAEIDDYYAILKTFRDAGYAGPVGLQCYQVPGDPRVHLKQSMEVWQALKQRFEDEAGPGEKP